MPTFRRLCALALLSLGLPHLRAALPFPQDGSDLRPDPAAHFGILPNGLRYLIYPNHEPRDRASLRLLVLSGSLEERDDQRGLAHFLEHMAFNGSAHYPPGTLVEYFQRLGLSFGGDTNAYTDFDHTAYQIELPHTKPDMIAEGLRVFADMAGTLLLRPDMIAKERPIILAEKRDRDSIDYREFVASFAFELPDARLPRRLPIGSAPVIEGATRPLFTDLYNTWYRPERMVAIVVGDIDPAVVQPLLVAAFGGLTDRAPARPNPDLGTVTVALGLRAGYHAEPDAPSTIVSIDVMTPYRPPVDSARVRRAHLHRDLAVAMLNRRLEILAKKEGAPFIRAEAAVDESYRSVRDAGINVTCKAELWREALAVGEQQLRSALQYGFTEGELRIAAANLRNDLEQAAAAAPTRRSPDLADAMVHQFVDGVVLTSPADDLALLGPALDQVTPNACADALRLAFSAPGRYLYVTGNVQIPGDAAAEIERVYAAAHAVAIAPPAPERREAFAYTQFGPPGRVLSARRVDDLDLTELTFANGVRANLKRTAFEADRIRVRVRVGGGLLTLRADQPALSLFTDATFAAGGLGRHSADDLQRLLAGHTVSLDQIFQVGSDAFEFAGVTNSADLLLQLQVLAAYLTDPGYRPEAMRVASKEIDEYYKQLEHTVEGPLEATVPGQLAAGDPRFGLPALAVAHARNLDEERAWLAPQWARGPIEIGLVGDLDPAVATDALARTFGALPARAAKPTYAAERIVHFPKPFTEHLTVVTDIPKTAVALYWPTTDAFDVHRARRLMLLKEILEDRLRVKIREQLGGAYSPEAESEPSDTFTGYGYLVAEVIVDPKRAEEIRQSVLALAADLAAHGATPDELKRAKQPVLTALRESARTNPYWLTAVLGSCQEFPQRLDWARSRYSDVESVTPADIAALASQYLGSERAFQVVVAPRGK